MRKKRLNVKTANKKLSKIVKAILLIVIYFFVIVLVAGTFALIYHSSNSANISFSDNIVDSNEEKTPDMLSCFYFSMITFFTVGYGDIVPISSLARVMVVIEGTIGLLVNVLFSGFIVYLFLKPVNSLQIASKAVYYSKKELLKIRYGSKKQLYDIKIELSFYDDSGGTRTHYNTIFKSRLSIINTWVAKVDLSKEKYKKIKYYLDKEEISFSLNIVAHDIDNNIHACISHYNYGDICIDNRYKRVGYHYTKGKNSENRKEKFYSWRNFNRVEALGNPLDEKKERKMRRKRRFFINKKNNPRSTSSSFVIFVKK